MNLSENFDINKPPKGAWIRQEADALVLGASVRTYKAFFLIFFVVGTANSTIHNREFFTSLTVFGILVDVVLPIFWLYMVLLTLLSIFGKIEIRLNDTHCKIFIGIGRIGKTKSFFLDYIAVRIREKKGQPYYVLLSNQKDVFEHKSDLKRSCYGYMLQALQKILNDKKYSKNFLQQGLEDDMSKHLLEP